MRELRGKRWPRAVVGTLALVTALSSACTATNGGAGPGASGGTVSPEGAPVRPAVEAEPLPPAVQEIEITATEYSFKISPDPAHGLRPGWTRVRFHNGGAEAHQVMFARIKDGVDLSELAAAGAGDSSGAGAIEFVDMIGGVSYIGPGHDTTALVDLRPGLVMAMCYVPDAKGVAHALMGMTTPLTVTAPVGGAAPDPGPGVEEVLGTIELAPGGYVVPARVGRGWYHVRNTDAALHEMAIMRLDRSIDDTEEEAIIADLAANRTPRVKVDAVGGLGAVSAGFDGYFYLDLDPGDYLAVDFMPDPGDPRPHLLDGYHARFRR